MGFDGTIEVYDDVDDWGMDYCVQKLLGTVPNHFGTDVNRYQFRQPRKIYITQLGQKGDFDCLDFIEAPLEVVQNERNKRLEDFLAQKEARLEKHVTPYGYYDPCGDSITLCLGPLRKLATEATRFFHNLGFNTAYASLIRSTFLHELTHSTFDYENRYREHKRLAEGVANLVPVTVGSQLDLAIQGFKVMRQCLHYNYHYVLARYNNLWDLLDAMIHRKSDLAIHLFRREVLQEAERMKFEKGACLRIKGNASHMYLGFGSTGVELFVGGTSDPICNFHGVVVVGTLREIEGYMDPSRSVIISNRIIEKPYYEILRPKTKCIYEVATEELNIKKELGQDNFDFDYIMGRIREIAQSSRNVVRS